jgi:hypothetical protein
VAAASAYAADTSSRDFVVLGSVSSDWTTTVVEAAHRDTR